MWLRVSSTGSKKQCSGSATFGQLLDRLDLVASVHQLGRYEYVVAFVNLVIKHRLEGLIGSSRRHLFTLIEALVQKGLKTHERLRDLERLIHSLFRSLTQGSYIASKSSFSILSLISGINARSNSTLSRELQLVQKWLNQIHNSRPFLRRDTGLTVPDLPIYVQRYIVGMLDDPEDIESMASVNSTMDVICNEPEVWRKLCFSQFTVRQIEASDSALEMQLYNTEYFDEHDLIWKKRYYFLQRKCEKKEYFAETLVLCRRCSILFWQNTGHPCVSEHSTSYQDQITPKELMTLLDF